MTRKEELKLARERQKRILYLFESYALHVRDWEPSKEGDWEGVKDSLFIILFDKED